MPSDIDKISASLNCKISVIRSARSKRLSMRVDVAGRKVRVTTPRWVYDWEINAFIAQNREWLEERLAQSNRVLLEPGGTVEILGVKRLVVLDGVSRVSKGPTDGPEGPIFLVGRSESPERKILAAIRNYARAHMEGVARRLATEIGETVRTVSVGDMVSRWGSCSRDKNISLSWRLVFAPEEVCGYVVAHEVAHLKHLNHGADICRLCRSISTMPPGHARLWLRHNGVRIRSIGPAS